MLFGSGNRDEREFGPSAEKLDVTREIKRHLAFSGSPHFCIGAHFARASARTALEALFTRAGHYSLGERERFPSPFVRGHSRLMLRLD